MHKMAKSFMLIIFLCNFIYVSGANAATIGAVGCSQTEVQNAIDSASDGDTVNVPAGNSTWVSSVNINKEITLQGAGIDQTNIICHVKNPNACLTIPAGTNNVRITGFTFDGDAVNDDMAIRVSSTSINDGCHDIRIDHNKFKDFRDPGITSSGDYVIRIYAYSYGVIDHNIFYDCRGEIILITGDGSEAYDRNTDLGLYENGTIFVEDNQFILSGVEPQGALNAIDANEGARYVFRYNTFQDAPDSHWQNPVDLHGLCVVAGQFGDIRGTLSYEVYNNQFPTTGKSGWNRGFTIRGGKGAIFNNTFTGSWDYMYLFTNERSYAYAGGDFCQVSSTRYSNPPYETQCHVDTDNEGPIINEGLVDGKLVHGQCRDQINGLYMWNNTLNGESVDNDSYVQIQDVGYQLQDIVEGVNFFFHEKPSYTSYPYPHPLTSVESPPTLTPPSGFTIIN